MILSEFPQKRLNDSEVATLVMGQSPSSEAYNSEEKGLPFYQGKTDFGLISPVPRVWCSELLRVAEPFDTLVSVRAPVGDVNLANEKCCIGRGVAAVRPALSINALFLFFALASVKRRLVALSTGTTFESINKTALEELEIPFPSKPEQEKIAATLWKIQHGIVVEEKIIATSRELKYSAMHQLFTRGLRGEPQKETDIGLVPKSWEIVELGRIAKVGNGSTPKRNNPDYWNKGKIPWLNSGKIHEAVIDSADQFVTELAAKECHLPLVKAGSVLVAITGQGKTLGNAAMVTFDTTINQHLAYAQFISDEMIPEFVTYFLHGRYKHLRSFAHGYGSTKGALTCSFLKSYLIPKPKPNEQREIAAILQTIDRKIGVHTRKRTTLQELFQTMLHQLMTGQIRVANLDIDTSEVVT